MVLLLCLLKAFIKPKLFWYNDLQATMKFYHKKWTVLLFLFSGLQKESSWCCKIAGPQFKPPLWSALTLVPLSIPGGLAKEGGSNSSSQLLSSMQSRATATGQALGAPQQQQGRTSVHLTLHLGQTSGPVEPLSIMEASRKERYSQVIYQGAACLGCWHHTAAGAKISSYGFQCPQLQLMAFFLNV